MVVPSLAQQNFISSYAVLCDYVTQDEEVDCAYYNPFQDFIGWLICKIRLQYLFGWTAFKDSLDQYLKTS